MVKKVKPEKLGKALSGAMMSLSDEMFTRFDKAYRSTVIDILGQIMIDTPVDKGVLRANWFLESANTSKTTKKGNGNKGQEYIRSRLKKVNKKRGLKMYFFNNLPYASTVEYGNYPQVVRRGTYDKRRKKYEKRSEGGFSRQAPEGMMRKNTSRFNSAFIKKLKTMGRIRGV